jgi:phosphomannomutase
MESLFGTNGIRWIVDTGDVDFPIRLGLAAGTYFEAGSRIAVGMDTRTSGPMIFNAVLSGLEASGCDVIDLGIVPTPTLQYAVKELDVDGGIIVTASHNPPKFNGLKFIAQDGTEFSREQESRIDSIFGEDLLERADWNKIGKHYHETKSYIDDKLADTKGDIIAYIKGDRVRDKNWEL